MEAQLIVLIKTPNPDPAFQMRAGEGGVFRFLLFISYSALFLNASAIISSLIMIDILGRLPYHNRHQGSINEVLLAREAPSLFEDFGVRGKYKFASVHCLSSNYKNDAQ